MMFKSTEVNQMAWPTELQAAVGSLIVQEYPVVSIVFKE